MDKVKEVLSLLLSRFFLGYFGTQRQLATLSNVVFEVQADIKAGFHSQEERLEAIEKRQQHLEDMRCEDCPAALEARTLHFERAEQLPSVRRG